MSPLEYAMKLDRLIQSLQTENLPFKKAVQTVHALRMERIFTRGEARDGRIIGKYSTKPIYINPREVGFSFQTKGKTRSTIKNVADIRGTGKIHKIRLKAGGSARATRYFAKGYKEFRQFINRPVDRVNLGLTYDMRLDLSNSKSINKPGMPDKISPFEYQERFKREPNALKAEGAFVHFKRNIFGFQPKEKKKFKEILQFEMARFLQGQKQVA